MSNEVYGFMDFPAGSTNSTRLESLRTHTPLGVREIPASELYGFPEAVQPGDNSFVFMVTDGPQKRNATYLVDYLDYAEDANIGLPLAGTARIGLLVELVNTLIKDIGASRLALAVTDSSQIEDVVSVTLPELAAVLAEDFEECAPPCTLYVIESPDRVL